MKQFSGLLLFVFIVSTMLCNGCGQSPSSNEAPVSEKSNVEKQTKKASPVADRNKLAGNWIRTDAPYQINITGVSDDGTLVAGYFNPAPINVGSALWADTDGLLQVYVELRDKNYPGSNYKLTYYPESDVLQGEYFQAVQGETYEVAFTRSR